MKKRLIIGLILNNLANAAPLLPLLPQNNQHFNQQTVGFLQEINKLNQAIKEIKNYTERIPKQIEKNKKEVDQISQKLAQNKCNLGYRELTQKTLLFGLIANLLPFRNNPILPTSLLALNTANFFGSQSNSFKEFAGVTGFYTGWLLNNLNVSGPLSVAGGVASGVGVYYAAKKFHTPLPTIQSIAEIGQSISQQNNH